MSWSTQVAVTVSPGSVTKVVASQGPNSQARLTVTNLGPDGADLSIAGILAVGHSRIYTLSQTDLDCKSVKGCTLMVQVA
jgi:hypothetical protein